MYLSGASGYYGFPLIDFLPRKKANCVLRKKLKVKRDVKIPNVLFDDCSAVLELSLLVCDNTHEPTKTSDEAGVRAPKIPVSISYRGTKILLLLQKYPGLPFQMLFLPDIIVQ